jgi:hypothetical protein
MNSVNLAGMHLTRRWQRRSGWKLIAWTERLRYCASSGLPCSALRSRIAISRFAIRDGPPIGSWTVGKTGPPAVPSGLPRPSQTLTHIVFPMADARFANGGAWTVVKTVGVRVGMTVGRRGATVGPTRGRTVWPVGMTVTVPITKRSGHHRLGVVPSSPTGGCRWLQPLASCMAGLAQH